ncbi:reverse transcriptase domain-containing protein, partial [Tanacetum coccineum]
PEEDPEEDPADYPCDGGDNDDDDDESSDDDEDDDIEEDEDKEEEEHLALADFVPPPVHRVTVRIYVRAQTHISLPLDTEVVRLLAIPTPPPLPLSPLSSPLPQILSPLPQILSPLPQILLPPLPVSSPPLPASPTYPLGYRATMIRLRAETSSTSHPLPSSTPPSGTPPLLPIPLPTPSPPLLLPSTNCRAGVSEVTLPPQKRLCIALGLRYEVDESLSAPTTRPTGGFRADYGFVGTLDDEIRRDTDKIYGRLDDAHDDRLLMSGQLNMLHRDRRAHARTGRLMETEARLSQTGTKRTTRSTPAVTTATATTVTDAQLKALIDQGIANALAARDADRSRNGEDSHDSGVVELTQWFERMEIVFRISNCTLENQIKFSTCILLGSALTWWNSHVKIVGHDVAYTMTWTNLKKKMTDKYCPRGEIKKLEDEMWNLKDVSEESDKIEKYVDGLPNMIHESSKNKRKQDDNQQQQQNKRQNTGKAYVAGSGEKKPYGGSKPL